VLAVVDGVAYRRAMRTILASVLSLAFVSAACSTPVAIGIGAAGGASLIGAATVWVPEDKCDGEGCAYSNAIALLLATLGASLVAVAGISLAVE
jgi:hypothetical protein